MYGGLQLRPYVVEFIRGVGVRVNGVVVQDAGGNGPFTWPLPDDVIEVIIDGCGAGGGGAGGSNSGTARGGAGGAGSAMSLLGYRALVYPRATLTVTVPAGGAGGAAGAHGTRGAAAIISGLAENATFTKGLPGLDNAGGAIRINGSENTYNFSAQAVGYNGGLGANAWDASTPVQGMVGASAGTGGASSGTPGDGAVGVESIVQVPGVAVFHSCGGCGGGGGSTTPTTAGGGSRLHVTTGSTKIGIFWRGFANAAVGFQDGTTSYGAGGQGGFSLFGFPGVGGFGSTADASNATAIGYGYGGSGGRAGGAGSAGGPAYVRITYWSAR